MKMTRLCEIARVVRSKNAKPFIMTIDVMCDELSAFRRIVNSGRLSEGAVARIYGVSEADIRVIPYPAARAIKITFPRPVPAGSFMDNDLLGAQQAMPLMDMEIP